MKKVFPFVLIALSLKSGAQNINLTANKWRVGFSADLKTAYLTPVWNGAGQGYENEFNFSATDGTMTEHDFGNSPIDKFKWIVKTGPGANSFMLTKDHLQWIFDFDRFQNDKYFYNISLKFSGKNQNASLFTTPGLKNRYYRLSTSTNPMVGYTLTKYNTFYYRGSIGEGDTDATVTKGLYVMVAKKLYCLALMKSDDNNINNFRTYSRRVSFDGNMIIPTLGKITTPLAEYNER